MHIDPEKHAWDLAGVRVSPEMKKIYLNLLGRVAEARRDGQKIELTADEVGAVKAVMDRVNKTRAQRRGALRTKQDVSDAERAASWLAQVVR